MPAHDYAKAEPQIDPVQRIERAEAFRNTGADIKHGRNSTQSNKIEDAITLPSFEILRDPESYYAAGIYGLCHWSGNASRFDCELKGRSTSLASPAAIIHSTRRRIS